MYPSSSPNSGPALVNIFSLVIPCKYAHEMSDTLHAKPFNSPKKNPSLTVSIPTTPEYMSSFPRVVQFSPATSLALCRLSYFTS